MGAAGVWIGTAFLATPEANVEQSYKDKLIEAESHQVAPSLRPPAPPRCEAPIPESPCAVATLGRSLPTA